jgi:hypothetical protein
VPDLPKSRLLLLFNQKESMRIGPDDHAEMRNKKPLMIRVRGPAGVMKIMSSVGITPGTAVRDRARCRRSRS